MRACVVCKRRKSLESFGFSHIHPKRRNKSCKNCIQKGTIWNQRHKSKRNIIQKHYFSRNKDRILSAQRSMYDKYRNRERLRSKQYRILHKQERQVKQKKYYRQYHELCKLRVKSWANRNPGKVRAITRKHQASRDHRIPAWANLKAISMFYKNCPKGMVVDHIIPLKGQQISGLHILSNLQYLTPRENSRKSNKYPY